MRLPSWKRDVVFGEDVGEAFDFSDVGDGEENALAIGVELLHFFQHGGNRAVEAGRGLGEECDGCLRRQAAGDAEVFDIGAGKSRGFLPPIVRRQIEIFGTNQIADAAALVGFVDAGPEAVELLLELIGFVEENGGARDEIEDGAVGSGDGRVELPAGKNVDSAGADGGFDDFFVADRCACR